MKEVIKLFILIFWILDILNMPFMEMFDTTYPLNTLFWILTLIFSGGIKININWGDEDES